MGSFDTDNAFTNEYKMEGEQEHFYATSFLFADGERDSYGVLIPQGKLLISREDLRAFALNLVEQSAYEGYAEVEVHLDDDQVEVNVCLTNDSRGVNSNRLDIVRVPGE